MLFPLICSRSSGSARRSDASAPAYSGGVKLERRHALALLAIAAWNVLTYAQFTRALATTEEDRPVAYYVAHTVLIVVNLGIAVVLGRWGLRALKADRADLADRRPAAHQQLT